MIFFNFSLCRVETLIALLPLVQSSVVQSQLVNMLQLTVKNGNCISIWNKDIMRVVIRFLFAVFVKSVEIILRMLSQYGDNCLSGSEIYKQINHFKSVRTSVCDDENLGIPPTSTTEKSIQSLERMFRKTDKSQCATLGSLLFVCPNERSSKRKKIFIR